MKTTSWHFKITARMRLMVAVLVGIAVAIGMGKAGQGRYVPLAAWDATAVVYASWVWLTVIRLNAADTKAHAVRENPGRALSDVLLILASIASLIAVVVLIVQAGNSTGAEQVVSLVLGLGSVVVSWLMVHTTYTLNYARQYYGDPEGGIDFGKSSLPRYVDFAYVAFTIGMTFQVSDTQLQTTAIRSTAMKQALLSYLFGTVIIATTINTLASLSK